MCSQISSYERMPFSQGHITGKESFALGSGTMVTSDVLCSWQPASILQNQGCFSEPQLYKVRWRKAKQEGRCWYPVLRGVEPRAHSCRAAAMISQVISHSFPCRMGCLSVTTPWLLTPQDRAGAVTVLGDVKAGGVIKLNTIKEKNHWCNKQAYSAQGIQHWAFDEHSAH